MSSNEYLTEVLEKLQNNPTSTDLDYFLEAYTRVGYLASVAQGAAELAEQNRRYAEATAYANARRAGAKSATDAERVSVIESHSARLVEINAREKAVKIKNLLNSIEQTINAIKYLGRQTEGQMILPRDR